MNLISKIPRISLYWSVSYDNPILLLDIYKHKFTFVTSENPRVESGITLALSFLRLRFHLAFYIDRPFNALNAAHRKMMERVNGKA